MPFASHDVQRVERGNAPTHARMHAKASKTSFFVFLLHIFLLFVLSVDMSALLVIVYTSHHHIVTLFFLYFVLFNSQNLHLLVPLKRNLHNTTYR